MAVVTALLFVALALTTQNEVALRRTGLDTIAVLGYCAALLLVIILDHHQIRGAIAPQQIAYLEIVSLISSVAVLLVSVNAVLLASPINVRFVEYKANILPKLLYWPVVLGLLLALTLMPFYL